MRVIFSVAILLLCTVKECYSDVLFLPGDSFFSSVLTEHSLEQWSAKEGVRVAYSGPLTSRGLGKSHGFQHLVIRDPGKVSDALRVAYSEVRRIEPLTLVASDDKGTGVLRESNAPRMFLYNSDYDIDANGLFLRYNEQWPKNEVVEYVDFVGTRDAVVQDWQQSERVAQLSVNITDDNCWIMSTDLLYVLLPFDDCKSYFRKKGEFVSVANNHVHRCRYLRDGSLDRQLIFSPAGVAGTR